MNQSIVVSAALATLLLSGGCGLFGQQQLEQCRGESDRLLAEYRTERDARQRFEIQNRALTDRIAELEQRLAVIGDVADPRLATRSAAPATASPPPATTPPASSGASSADSALASPAATAPAEASPEASAPAAGSGDSLAKPSYDAAPDPWRAVPRPR